MHWIVLKIRRSSVDEQITQNNQQHSTVSFWTKLPIVVLGFIATQAASETTAPDAGVFLEQLEQERHFPLPGKTEMDQQPAPKELQALQGETIQVKNFKFAGNTLLTDTELSTAIASYLNRPLDFETLKDVARHIAETYRQAGWIVKAYLPQQDITSGIVTIQIIEAVFGGVQTEGKTSQRLLAVRAMAIIAAAQNKGELLNSNNLDRGLLLLSDLPGITTNSNLIKGQHAKETDLLLKLTDQSLWQAKLSGDNNGSRSTGPLRFNAVININSPLKIGDQITGNVMHSEGSNYGRLSYSLPLSADGWRLDVNAAYLDYQLVTAEFKPAGIQGNSVIVGADLNYPWLRSRLKNIYFGVSFDHKRFNNQANAANVSRYNINDASISINGNLFDNFLGGGANSLGLTFTEGYVDLSDSPNQTDIAKTTRTDGFFSKFRYNLTRQQAITEDISLYAAFSGQVANKNLDSAEKMYLGGSNGVRAYPNNEGGGTDAQMLNLELRSRLPWNVNVVGFYDIGHVTLNTNNQFSGAAPVNDYVLQGAGVTLGVTTVMGLNLKATWAHRIDNNPNPNKDGKDQDGSLDRQRFWFTVTLPLS